ncbi:MAG: sulfatase-like hydrolase/transferase, partial [Planctomycetes bacterium]|nr:sulfatase-like hydrolase/transferase [Planctomycetota bacterium]
FEDFSDSGPVIGIAEDVVDRTLASLAALPEDRPYVLWMHLMDPHASYSAPGTPPFGTRPIDLYDAEIRYADEHFGRVLDALRARQDWDRTVLIVQSDHGEEFGEHGGRYHSSSLYEEQIRVPLVWRVPGLAPIHVPTPVELVDLPATIRNLFVLPPDISGQGDDLCGLMVGERPADPSQVVVRAQFREHHLSQGLLDALRMGDEKLIRQGRSQTWELYDLARDPGETENLAFDRPERLEALRSRLQARRSKITASASPVATADQRLLQATGPARLEIAIELAEQGLGDQILCEVPGLLAPERSDAVRLTTLRRIRVWGHYAEPDALRRILDEQGVSHLVLVAALQALAHVGDAGDLLQLAALRERDLPPEVTWHLLCTRASLGDASCADELEDLMPQVTIELQFQALAALSVAKEAVYGSTWAGLVMSGFIPWESLLEAVTILGRGKQFSARAASYFIASERESVGPVWATILKSIAELPLTEVLPIYRALMSVMDLEVRSAARGRLKDGGYSEFMDDMTSLQDTIESAKNALLAQQLNANHIEAILEAHGVLDRTGLDDWGAIIDALDLATKGELEPALIDRIAVLAERAGICGAASRRVNARPARIALSVVLDTPIGTPPGMPELLLVRLEAEASGGAVPSAMTANGRSYLRVGRYVDGDFVADVGLPVSAPVLGLTPGQQQLVAIVVLRSSPVTQEAFTLVVRADDQQGEVLAELTVPRAAQPL